MDTTRIQTRIGIPASADDIWELIGDLSAWERWNAYETGVSGAISFKGSISFDEAFPNMEARQAEMRVAEWEPGAQLVLHEKRGLWFRSMRYFEIERLDRNSSIFTNGMVFMGLRGEMFHDKHRPKMRQATDAIAEAMRIALAD